MISQTSVFHCPKCKKSVVMYSQHHRSATEQAQILCAYRERTSMRGIARLHNISRNTLKKMLKKK